MTEQQSLHIPDKFHEILQKLKIDEERFMNDPITHNVVSSLMINYDPLNIIGDLLNVIRIITETNKTK